MTSIKARRKHSKQKESGYMLLFLMIAVAVLTITMLGVARSYRRSILRDREVEMIHRGTEYARAIKKYYHKNGRYPASIEQLENTNNLRFLRKRYKDPMSPDGEWKLVHDTDLLGITLKAGSGLGLTPTSGAGIGTSTPSPDTTASNPIGTPAASAFGTPAQGTNTSAGSQVFGGGAIAGVVSKSKAEGIHSFGDKTKYEEWFFIYTPTQDTGKSLLTGPYNPNMFVGAVSSGIGNKTGSGASSTGGAAAPVTPPPTPPPTP